MKKDNIKALSLIIISILIQLVFYYIIKLVSNEPTLIGWEIDKKIMFCSLAIIPYVLWYAMIFIFPFMFYKKNKNSFLKYIISYIVVLLIADTIFMIYPTIINRPNIEVNSFLTYLTNLIYNIDNPPVNCFPSLHCAVSFLWILYALEIKDLKNIYKIIVIISSILVIVSTLFIKQHVLVDVIGGILLAIIVYFIIKIFNKKIPKIIKYLNI